MGHWFQNLKKDDREKRLFHFRGSLSSGRKRWLQYSFVSGPSLCFKFQHGEAGDDSYSSMLSVGFLFFTMWLTFSLPKRCYFMRKCIATWENNREFYLVDGRKYGFYFYHWSFVWSFHRKVDEHNSSDPWWMHQYIHLDELVFGKWECLRDELASTENIKFKLGGNEFVMNSIAWERNRRFRRFIPYSFYHQTYYSVKMDIKKPPQFSGKGENSWDCGDDAIYGLSGPWKHKPPTWLNYKESAKIAVQDYVNSVLKNAKRYGGSTSEGGVNKDSQYEFIGA